MSLYLGDKLVLPVQYVKSGFTGHVDAVGLAEIGWNEADIAYLQERVWWNEEDDDLFVVGDTERELWSIVQEYPGAPFKDYLSLADGVRFLPKIDTSGQTDFAGAFVRNEDIVAVPMMNTTGATSFYQMFAFCPRLACVPNFDTTNVTNTNSMFSNCWSFRNSPQLDMSNVSNAECMFVNCHMLKHAPDFSQLNATSIQGVFGGCYSLEEIDETDVANAQNDAGSALDFLVFACFSLRKAHIKNIGDDIDLSPCTYLRHESLVYIINHAQAVDGKTMRLGNVNLAKLTDDEIAVATGKGWTVV